MVHPHRNDGDVGGHVLPGAVFWRQRGGSIAGKTGGDRIEWLMDASFKLGKADSRFPVELTTCLGDLAPDAFSVLGNLEILQRKPLALFCSVRCPGNLIVQTYDLTHKLRRAGVTVMGGFHSPMERRCLDILLRSPHPVILCPA